VNTNEDGMGKDEGVKVKEETEVYEERGCGQQLVDRKMLVDLKRVFASIHSDLCSNARSLILVNINVHI
jgi:hypothetical protein